MRLPPNLVLLAILLLSPCSTSTSDSDPESDLNLNLDPASTRPLTWYFSRFSSHPPPEHLELLREIGLPFATFQDGQVAILLFQEESEAEEPEQEEEGDATPTSHVKLSTTPFCPKEEELEEETKEKYSTWHLKLGLVAARKEVEEEDKKPFYLACALLATPVQGDDTDTNKVVLASSKLDDRWREVDGAKEFLEGLSDKLVWIRSALPKMVKPKLPNDRVQSRMLDNDPSGLDFRMMDSDPEELDFRSSPDDQERENNTENGAGSEKDDTETVPEKEVQVAEAGANLDWLWILLGILGSLALLVVVIICLGIGRLREAWKSKKNKDLGRNFAEDGNKNISQVPLSFRRYDPHDPHDFKQHHLDHDHHVHFSDNGNLGRSVFHPFDLIEPYEASLRAASIKSHASSKPASVRRVSSVKGAGAVPANLPPNTLP